MAKSATNTVNAVRTTFRILETLEERDGARVTEVANALDLPKSTIHNHLQTLLDEEYIVKDPDDQRYRIALRHLKFGEQARNQTVFQVAKPEVRRLASDTGEHANFAMTEHGYGVYVFKETGEKAVKLDSYPGKRVFMHTTAFGKAMLAHFPEGRVEEILDRHGLPERTEHTITNRETLFEELAEIRSQGYAVDNEERLLGMRCVAAPILASDDAILGAISVSGPKSRITDEYITEELVDSVVGAANVIEINTTYI